MYFNSGYLNNSRLDFKDYSRPLVVGSCGTYRLKKRLSLRMVNAQSLLENTEYNIGEIAEIVGYDNPLYFSRVFKKEYGVSPAQYRKNLEGSTEK